MTREDCNDVVSRKAVINLILEDAVRTGTGHRYTSIQNMNNEINEVRSLPPVTPTQNWIPTSERQPKENGNYLAFYRSGDGTAALEFMMVDHCNAGGGWLHEEKGRKIYKKVIAWMPLPEPYKAEMESEE